MIDFCNAIKNGLRNAAAAESAEREVQDVLEKVLCAIEATSHGKVTLAMPTLAGDRGGRSIELVSATSSAHSVRIATYQTSAEGYPVSVDAYGHALSANDAESFRHILESLLERSEVGRHLRQLMDES